MSWKSDKAVLLFAIGLGIVAVILCGVFLAASGGEESPRPLIISTISLISLLLVNRWRQNRTKD